MAKVLIRGMWVMNPFLQYDAFVCYLCMTLENTNYNNLENEFMKPLKPASKSKLNIIVIIVSALRFRVVRILHNYLQILALWLMKKYPFLAYYRFGKANSHVLVWIGENTKTIIEISFITDNLFRDVCVKPKIIVSLTSSSIFWITDLKRKYIFIMK